MEFRNILNKNINYLIEKQGVKIFKLANDFQLNRTTISHYLTDKSIPRLDFLVKFAKYFNVSVDDLLFKDLSAPDYVPSKNDKGEVEILKEKVEMLQEGIELYKQMLDACKEMMSENRESIKKIKETSNKLLEGRKMRNK